MKKSPHLLLALLSVFPFLVLVAHADYTLVVKTTTVTPRGDTVETVTKKVKGDFKLTETAREGPRGFLKKVKLLDSKAESECSIFNEEKAWMAMPRLTESQQKSMIETTGMAMQKSGQILDERPVPRSTGRKEKIGEYETEVFECQCPAGDFIYWVAPALIKIRDMEAAAPQLPATELGQFLVRQYPDTLKIPGFIVKSKITYLHTLLGPGNGVTKIEEFVSFSEAELDGKDFKIPEGYAEKQAPAIPVR